MLQTKLRVVLLLGAAAAMLVGCMKEKPWVSEGNVLKARIEGAQTKTSYDDAQGKFVWTAGDQIAVCFSDGTFTDYEVAGDGSLAVASSNSRYRQYYAVYPASAKVSGHYGSSDLQVNLPEAYDITTIVANATGNPGADYSPMPMVAVNDEESSILDFYHVGGLLRITVSGVKPATQKIRVTFDKDVTGTYTVNTDITTAPTITTAGAATNNVVTYTIAASSVGNVTDPIVLNVPVPCGTYNSVRVECLNSSGTNIASRLFDERQLDFQRHHGRRLATDELTADFVFGYFWDASVTYTGGPGSLTIFPFTSYKTVGSDQEAVPFTLEYSEDDGATWSTDAPTWLTPSAKDYNGSMDGPYIPYGINLNGSINGQLISMTVAPQVNLEPDPYHISLASKTPYDTPKDLSTVNVATGADLTGHEETANCYVVDRPGLYKFPLVYGNGIKNGGNQDAYRGRNGVGGAYYPEEGTEVLEPDPVSQTFNYLGSFLDHQDDYINTPYIAVQHSDKTLTPALVWTDVPDLINPASLSISGSLENAYLSFEVPADYITKGNALVAVLADGVIAWSWHIWVTDDDLTATTECPGNLGYHFAPVNLGWVDGFHQTYESRTCKIRATQAISGKVATATLTQNGASFRSNGNNPYYQFGRKDPLPAWRGNSTRKTYYYPSNAAYTHQEVSNFSSIGNAIQTPYIHYNKSMNWCSVPYNNLWSSSISGNCNSEYGIMTETEINNAKTKTIYDPSPVGFRVPSADAMKSLEGNMSADAVQNPVTEEWGFQSNNGLFLPRVGKYNVWTSSVFGPFCSLATNVPSFRLEEYLDNYYSNIVFEIFGASNTNILVFNNFARSDGASVRPIVDE